jgi:hypothetical protein
VVRKVYPVGLLKLSCSVHFPPPVNSTWLAKDIPFEVIVLVVKAEFRVYGPVWVRVIAAPSVRLPVAVITFVPAKVPVNPAKDRFFADTLAPVVTVTAPEAASKYTSSLVVGTAAPPPPPEVVDHFKSAVPFHVSVPPTQ